MNINIKRLRFVKTFVLICLVFSFNAAAQTSSEKPLNAKGLAALTQELKKVVTKNSPDENEAKSVIEKWDERKDLAGKTKSEVIKLLYQDVKSGIKDSGTLYQIYSTFSFYRQMPDKSFSGQTTSPMVTNSKPKAVENLNALTFPAHPFVGIEAELAKLPGTEDIKAEEERIRKERIAGFDDVLKVNNKLTPEQKEFVKANYDGLIKIADKITEEAIKKNFPTEVWILEGLKQSYSKFTLKELNELINFFDSNNGSGVLKYIRQTNMAELITGNGGTLDYTEADKAEYDKFASTALGKKFITAYLTEAEAYEKRKEEAVRTRNPNADGFGIYEPENLNKLFNTFVTENYKK